MQRNRTLAHAPLMLTFALCFPAQSLLAQRSHIISPIDNSRRVRLSGQIHPKATPEYDQGSADPSLLIPSVTLVLKQSPSQQAELDKLLAEQQDPSSPDYHHWLTPEEYGNRFGASTADIDKITAWLEQQGMHVTAVGRARNWVSASGTAGAVDKAFGTEIHRYQVNGRRHFSNATNPSIPEALGVIVKTIHGLNDFRMEPKAIAQKPRAADTAQPAYTSSSGNHYISPDDLSTVYNLKPLYNSGIDGTGQKIVVAGQTQIDPGDIQQFRTRFGLAENDPQAVLVPNTRDPGKSTDDMVEADLDLEWAGARRPTPS